MMFCVIEEGLLGFFVWDLWKNLCDRLYLMFIIILMYLC